MLTGRKILLVEDEAFIAMDLEHQLTDQGAIVVGPVATLRKAEDAARHAEIDAAILDIMLGRDEVFPAADILRDRGVPFLFHSAHAELDRIERAYPGVGLVQKPGGPNELMRRLAALLDARAAA
ncbi:response regulator [Jannaschia sp. KMU-145]|uniref:response regulator n=1 Tax=Jannaschia halovivens TaxID=3388667 RepID=UPI00396B2CF6